MKLPRILLVLFVAFFILVPVIKAADQSVSIESSGFVPATVTIYESDLVTWTNNATSADSATDDDQAWDTGTIAAGSSKSIKFLSAGTYTYSNSTETASGTIVVESATVSATPTPTATPAIGGDATGSSQPVSGVSGPTLIFLFSGAFFIIAGIIFSRKAHQLV